MVLIIITFVFLYSESLNIKIPFNPIEEQNICNNSNYAIKFDWLAKNIAFSILLMSVRRNDNVNNWNSLASKRFTFDFNFSKDIHHTHFYHKNKAFVLSFHFISFRFVSFLSFFWPNEWLKSFNQITLFIYHSEIICSLICFISFHSHFALSYRYIRIK